MNDCQLLKAAGRSQQQTADYTGRLAYGMGVRLKEFLHRVCWYDNFTKPYQFNGFSGMTNRYLKTEGAVRQRGG